MIAPGRAGRGPVPRRRFAGSPVRRFAGSPVRRFANERIAVSSALSSTGLPTRRTREHDAASRTATADPFQDGLEKLNVAAFAPKEGYSAGSVEV
jgi:hypothetical protein